MNQGWKRLFILLAALWAVFCGGFAHDVTQREKRSLYREYVGRYDSAQYSGAQHIPLDGKTRAQREKDLRAYEKALRELYWVVAPFFWLSITLGGYIVVAGIFLPVRWIK